jgi:hypothetical protein
MYNNRLPTDYAELSDFIIIELRLASLLLLRFDRSSIIVKTSER